VREASAIAYFDLAEAGARRPRDSRRDAGATVGIQDYDFGHIFH